MSLEYKQEVQDFFELVIRTSDVNILIDHFPRLFNPLTLFQYGVRLGGSQELVSFPHALQNNGCLTPFLDCLDQLFPEQNYPHSLVNYPMDGGSLLERQQQAQNQQELETSLSHLEVAEQPATSLPENRVETPPINFQQTPPLSPRTPVRPQLERVCPEAPNIWAMRRTHSVNRAQPYDVAQFQAMRRRRGSTIFNPLEDDQDVLANLMAAQGILRNLFPEEVETQEDGLVLKV